MESDLVEREERGPVSLLTMVYGPYNLLGPKLMGALAAQLSAACDAGSRAIVLRSGLRHFCAGADVSLFGGRIEQVIRTRMFVTDISQWEQIGKAHGEFFSAIRPATSMVEVSRLIDPDMLVEIEADAYIPDGK